MLTLIASFVLLSTLVLESSCSQDEEVSAPRWPPLPPDAVPLAYVDPTSPFSAGAWSERGDVVIAEGQAWESFWAKHVSGYRPAPPTPAIDFTQSVVLVSASGEKATGGYGISITGVFENDGKVIVQVLETIPGPKCPLPQITSAPTAVAQIARRNKPVEFVHATAVRGCAG